MAVFSKDAVAAALDQLCQSLDEAKGGGGEAEDDDKSEEGSGMNGVLAPQTIIPPILEQYLERIAKTGNALLPWTKLKPLVILKLEKVIENITNEEEDLSFLDEKIQVSASDGSPLATGEGGDACSMHILKMKKRIVNALNNFQGIPFTIQRLCELLTQPKKYYKRIDKLLRGFEKNVRIVRTISPLIPGPPLPPPPVPINSALSLAAAAACATSSSSAPSSCSDAPNSDAFVLKTTAIPTSSSLATSSSSPLSNSEKQEVNLPASSSSFASSSTSSSSSLDPLRFAKDDENSNFGGVGAGDSLMVDCDGGDAETTTGENKAEKMEEGESGVGAFAGIGNFKAVKDVAGLARTATNVDGKGEKDRIDERSNVDVCRVAVSKREAGGEFSDEAENEVDEKVGTRPEADRREIGRAALAVVSVEPRPELGSTADGGVSSSPRKPGEDAVEAESTGSSTPTALTSPMKRKRSVGAKGDDDDDEEGDDEEDEDEPPMKRNSPDIIGDREAEILSKTKDSDESSNRNVGKAETNRERTSPPPPSSTETTEL